MIYDGCNKLLSTSFLVVTVLLQDSSRNLEGNFAGGGQQLMDELEKRKAELTTLNVILRGDMQSYANNASGGVKPEAGQYWYIDILWIVLGGLVDGWG